MAAMHASSIQTSHLIGRPVRRPAGVCNARVRGEGLGEVQSLSMSREARTDLFGNRLLQGRNLSPLLDHGNRGRLVNNGIAVNGHTSRVIAAVLQPLQAIQQNVDDELALTRNAVIQIRKDPAHGCKV